MADTIKCVITRGSHSMDIGEGQRKRFVKGDVIDIDQHTLSTFRNKFEPVHAMRSLDADLQTEREEAEEAAARAAEAGDSEEEYEDED